MATRETIELEPNQGAGVKDAINTRRETVGLIGTLDGKRVVAVVVEDEPKPKKKSGDQ